MPVEDPELAVDRRAVQDLDEDLRVVRVPRQRRDREVSEEIVLRNRLTRRHLARALIRGRQRDGERMAAACAELQCVRAAHDHVLLGEGEAHLAVDVRQLAQMCREHDANHGSVCTSTESTAGRSRTIAFHVSPASAEA